MITLVEATGCAITRPRVAAKQNAAVTSTDAGREVPGPAPKAKAAATQPRLPPTSKVVIVLKRER
jgi:hypothetical protein